MGGVGQTKIIDSFIMSQPSRIVNTFVDMLSNGLMRHIGVTCLETLIGFSGTARHSRGAPWWNFV